MIDFCNISILLKLIFGWYSGNNFANFSNVIFNRSRLSFSHVRFCLRIGKIQSKQILLKFRTCYVFIFLLLFWFLHVPLLIFLFSHVCNFDGSLHIVPTTNNFKFLTIYLCFFTKSCLCSDDRICDNTIIFWQFCGSYKHQMTITSHFRCVYVGTKW